MLYFLSKAQSNASCACTDLLQAGEDVVFFFPVSPVARQQNSLFSTFLDLRKIKAQWNLLMLFSKITHHRGYFRQKPLAL